jgi:hypothetical protein
MGVLEYLRASLIAAKIIDDQHAQNGVTPELIERN